MNIQLTNVETYVKDNFCYRYSATLNPIEPLVIGFVVLTPAEYELENCLAFAVRQKAGAVEIGFIFNGGQRERGPDNKLSLIDVATRSAFVMCAWGNGAPKAITSATLALLQAAGIPRVVGCTRAGNPMPLIRRAHLSPITVEEARKPWWLRSKTNG